MQESFDIYSLKFINKTDIIEEVEEVFSGALLYKVTRGENKFFLKIFKGTLDIDKVKKSVSIYKKLNIKSLDIIDFGTVENLDKCYIVYNFIEGKNLKAYTNTDEFSLSEVRKIGTIIGKELLKLKVYEDYDNDLLVSEDIDVIINNAENNFNLLLKNEIYRNIILKYFTVEEVNDLNKKLVEYGNMFKDIEPGLIHGDIKRTNVMVGQNKEFYITDIESMQVGYDVLNFRYQMTWSLFNGSEKEAEFVKGYFDGIYSGNRPNYFNYGIIFTIILNFFTEAYKRYRCSNIIGVETYVKKCKDLFNKIDKMDLSTQFIV